MPGGVAQHWHGEEENSTALGSLIERMSHDFTQNYQPGFVPAAATPPWTSGTAQTTSHATLVSETRTVQQSTPNAHVHNHLPG